MELLDFIGENAGRLCQTLQKEMKISYCVKLSNVINRREDVPATSKFASMVSGISNLVSDTVASAVYDSYFIGLSNGTVGYISEKPSHMFFKSNDVTVSMTVESGLIQFMFSFSSGIIQSAVMKLSSDTIANTVWGELADVFRDFDFNNKIQLSHLSRTYANIRISKPGSNADKPYEMNTFHTSGTLVSYDGDGIYLNNELKTIPFSEILLYHDSPHCYTFLTYEQKSLVLYEVFRNQKCKSQELGLNFLLDYEEEMEAEIEINFPEQMLRPKQFLSACQNRDFIMITIDDRLFFLTPAGLMEGGVFAEDSVLYVKLVNGTFSSYADLASVIHMLPLLPAQCDTIFLHEKEAQPCILGKEEGHVLVRKMGLEVDNQFHAFDKMRGFHYVVHDNSCRITYEYEEQEISLLTAGSLGIHISNTQERVSISEQIKNYTINQLYDFYCKNQTKNFIAGTFAEIFKTNKLLNYEISVDEILDAMDASDNPVLRNAFQSVVGRFKDVDDLQSNLIQKLSLLEIQRRKIHKMLDEWILFYPHYAASVQVEWLKNAFSPFASEEILKTEYWKCVVYFKRVLNSANVHIQKTLNEIGLCMRYMLPVMPEEVKRINIPGMLRVSPRNHVQAMQTGANVMLALTTGAEIANFFVRGFSAANPLALSMSIKMLTDSFAKDVAQRKDVKAFGEQALEWWQVLMKSLSIHVLELSKEFNDYSQMRIRRDTELFKKIPLSEAGKIKARLSDMLKEQILQGVDEKYLEIAPQFNLRIANILEDVDFQSGFCTGIIKEFEENLFV